MSLLTDNQLKSATAADIPAIVEELLAHRRAWREIQSELDSMKAAERKFSEAANRIGLSTVAIRSAAGGALSGSGLPSQQSRKKKLVKSRPSVPCG